jgi:hypothetical protein
MKVLQYKELIEMLSMLHHVVAALIWAIGSESLTPLIHERLS